MICRHCGRECNGKAGLNSHERACQRRLQGGTSVPRETWEPLFSDGDLPPRSWAGKIAGSTDSPPLDGGPRGASVSVDPAKVTRFTFGTKFIYSGLSLAIGADEWEKRHLAQRAPITAKVLAEYVTMYPEDRVAKAIDSVFSVGPAYLVLIEALAADFAPILGRRFGGLSMFAPADAPAYVPRRNRKVAAPQPWQSPGAPAPGTMQPAAVVVNETPQKPGTVGSERADSGDDGDGASIVVDAGEVEGDSIAA